MSNFNIIKKRKKNNNKKEQLTCSSKRRSGLLQQLAPAVCSQISSLSIHGDELIHNQTPA